MTANLQPAVADPGPQELAFLEMPGMVSLLPEPGNEQEFEAAGMDPRLRALAERVIQGPPRRVLPESGDAEYAFEPRRTYSGFEHDLDGDGNREVFLQNPVAGGSGGWVYEVFSCQEGVWRQVASLQAVRVWLGKSQENLPVLVSIGRAGGSSYTRVWRQASEGAWRTVRVEDYDLGTVTERDPADFADWDAELPDPPLRPAPPRPSRRDGSAGTDRDPSASAIAAARSTHPSGSGHARRSGGFVAWWLAGLILLAWLGWRIRRSGRFRLKP